MKVCKYCGIEKDESEFEIANVINGVTYRRRKCSVCKQTRQRDRRKEGRDFVIEYKKGKSCLKCGFDDYRALCFHHRESDTKEFEVSTYISQGASLERVKKEIDKCDVLCCNCHMIEHAIERQKSYPIGI